MKQLEKIISSFKKKSVITIGDIILDKFILGDIPYGKTNPEAPALLVNAINEEYSLGGAANVANNISSLGANSYLYGVVGNDSSGEFIRTLCKEKNIDSGLITPKNMKTLIKERVLAQGQQVFRIDYGEFSLRKIDKNEEETLFRGIRQKLISEPIHAIILSDYNKNIFTKDFSREIINLAKEKNISILVDPKPENIAFFKGCNVLCPNEKEAEKITGIKYSNGTGVLENIAHALHEKTDANYTFITCGKEGVYGYDFKSGKHLMIPTNARKVANPTGAGDVFAAALTLSLSAGADIESAAKIANYAAGISVESPGTVAVSNKELLERIRQEH